MRLPPCPRCAKAGYSGQVFWDGEEFCCLQCGDRPAGFEDNDALRGMQLPAAVNAHQSTPVRYYGHSGKRIA